MRIERSCHDDDAVIKVAALFVHSRIQRKASGKILKHKRTVELSTNTKTHFF